MPDPRTGIKNTINDSANWPFNCCTSNMEKFSLNMFFELFDELYTGSIKPPVWVIDPGPASGILGVLTTVSAQQASTPLVQGGSTIAAHAEHLRWSLQFALSFFKGKVPDSDCK
jgi:hypothetical protein